MDQPMKPSVEFDCPYAACIWPRCLNEGGTAACYPLCSAEDWSVRDSIAKRLDVRPRRKELEQV